MFEFNKKLEVSATDYDIENEEIVLFEDITILSIADNIHGKVITSSISEDTENSYYIILNISDEDLFKFRSRFVSYRQLLDKYDSLVIMEYGEESKAYKVSFSDFPEEYKPTKDTFIPKFYDRT